MSESYCESTAKTNRLHCTDCGAKIKIGESVVFLLDDCKDKPMQAVYCHKCKSNYAMEVASEQHPHDLYDGFYNGEG